MKSIGLIGGLTYVSTIEYYRYLNELANEKLGGTETVQIILYSVNFGEIKVLTEAGEWGKISDIICKVAQTIERAGASCLLIGANTMHKIADEVQAAIKIPVIHIAEAVAKAILKNGLRKVGLIGTRYTMQLEFYTDHLAKHGIETIIPDQEDIEYINYTIYNEFSKNIFTAEAKTNYLNIISKLKERGAEGIIGGCTEISILIKQSDCDILIFDTAKIHSEAGVEYVTGS
ncbi:MAG: amino acid racemase [Bacteroidetes bacterium]|nr:MAG: amino acid racemase [Bacteroidota bacterium]